MWRQSYLDKARNGLRQAAKEGKFVPGVWIQDYDSPDQRPRGCGWGLIGWLVAVALRGAGFAKYKMQVFSTQKQVNEVLLLAGLTEYEILRMTPENAWKYFDRELIPYYDSRLNGAKEWDAYIAKSEELAEFFIRVLERVPVEGAVVQPEPATITNLNQQVPGLDVPIHTDVVITGSIDKIIITTKPKPKQKLLAIA